MALGRLNSLDCVLSGLQRSGGAASEPSTAQPLLSEAVLARMKQRRASIEEDKKLGAGRKRNSIDLASFGKGLVVETF